MRSLFAKILGWFLATLLLTLAASIVVGALTYDDSSSRPAAPLTALINVQMGEARHAWETGGREALAATLARFRDETRALTPIFTDAEGTDLATGAPHPDLVRRARVWSQYPFNGHQAPFARMSADGRYFYFLGTSNRLWFRWFLQPAQLVVLALSVLLCYALAYHLTSPLRKLQRAVDQFGRGDLEARAGKPRGDELGDLARAFNRMADRIQTLLAAERRLLLDISHELRSPLARLSVAVELARSGSPGALPLDRIQKEADRLNALIGQMLEVTRVEGDPGQRRAERVRLDELVESLVDDCSIEAHARGCSLDLNPPPAVTVEGDSELLRRAVENVVRNAIRYAPPKSRVEVAIEDSAGGSRVSVRDYGPGVPEESLAHLFDPFYRVEPDRNRESGGVGLGLSIARRAVELHRGTLRASNASPGLLVEIDLPS